jgi:hypothetical protein
MAVLVDEINMMMYDTYSLRGPWLNYLHRNFDTIHEKLNYSVEAALTSLRISL